MPNNDISTHRFSNAPGVLKSTQSVNATNYAIFQNIGTMSTYLLGQGYTQTQLDKMPKNDMIMACRAKIGSTVDPSK